MKLYLLKRKEFGYDEYDEKLVRAANENRARELANNCTGDEGAIWTNKKYVSCEAVNISGEEGVVMASFNAG